MASYLFLVVLLSGSSMLLAASYDILGLGPANGVSLGTRSGGGWTPRCWSLCRRWCRSGRSTWSPKPSASSLAT
jgi:hypothetical protein